LTTQTLCGDDTIEHELPRPSFLLLLAFALHMSWIERMGMDRMERRDVGLRDGRARSAKPIGRGRSRPPQQKTQQQQRRQQRQQQQQQQQQGGECL